jgi:hypothetical protein
MPTDLASGVVAFLLTLMVLSYLVGDNPAFRIAIHLLVGVAAGYVAVVAWWQIVLPDLIVPLLTGPSTTRAILAVPLLLSGMLLMKGWPPLSRLGAPALGLLVGAASATAIGGAVQGTLFPQLSATLEALSASNIGSLETLINGALVLAGLVTSLAYFHFAARSKGDGSPRRAGLLELVAGIGAVFLALTLGVLLAGVYSASLTALIERLGFVRSFLGL